MPGLNRLEEYLIELKLDYQEIEDGSYLLNDPSKGIVDFVLSLQDPIVVVRCNVMRVPKGNNEEFYQTLLTLNARDLIHGAYALDGDSVILMDTLNYAGMDRSELESSIDSLGLALSQHYTLLSGYRNN